MYCTRAHDEALLIAVCMDTSQPARIERAPLRIVDGAGLGHDFFSSFFSLGILVYTDGGAGASEGCVAMTLTSLRRAVALIKEQDPSLPPLSVATTEAGELTSGKWMDSCGLLVMPGGRDLPYVAKLQGTGNRHIRDFVRNGGGYLGLCAGGYYGASFVEFAKGDAVFEVVGERELAFFPGVAQGPLLPGFEYKTHAGARAVRISLSDTALKMAEAVSNGCSQLSAANPLTIYYNGGCHFLSNQSNGRATETATTPTHKEATESHSPFEVLARYEEKTGEGGEKTQGPAVAMVACKFGRGRAVLSGVHVEASAELLGMCYSGDPHITPLLPRISTTDSYRELLLSGIVKYLLSL